MIFVLTFIRKVSLGNLFYEGFFMLKKLSIIFLLCLCISTANSAIFSDRTKSVALATVCISAAVVPTYYALQHLKIFHNIAGYTGRRFSRHDITAFGRDISAAIGLFGRAWGYFTR